MCINNLCVSEKYSVCTQAHSFAKSGVNGDVHVVLNVRSVPDLLLYILFMALLRFH